VKKYIAYPRVSAEEWAKRIGIKIEPLQCYKCKKYSMPSIPFRSSVWWGIKTPLHACGKQYQAYMTCERDPKERAKWANLFRKTIQSETETRKRDRRLN